MLSQIRSRLRLALRWLAPSALAACAGGLVAGLVEARGAIPLGAIAALATAGFLALVTVPVLLLGGAIARALLAAWQPRLLVERLTDDDGAAPRLAGWVAVVWLGAVGLSSLTFQGVWMFASHTAFKPASLAYLEPIFTVAVVLGMVALSRPCARLFSWLAGTLDARWRRRGHRTLLRPRVILAAPLCASAIALGLVWFLGIKPRIGPLDLAPLLAPAAGIAVAILAHAWPRRGRRPLAIILATATFAVLAIAGAAPFVRPSTTLEIWGDQPLAGLAIETLFDLDELRTRISTVEFRPDPRPSAKHPDILLITIDTVRADHTPPYGGSADMPALRDLGQRGTVFEWAFSPSNVTRRSVPSIVTGLAPNHVRGRVVGWALRVDPRHVLLAERMRAGGYDTAGFMCCEGFWGKEVHTGLERGLSHLEIDPRGTALAQAAHTWLAAREQPNAAPLFVWMHILEPHNWTQAGGTPNNEPDRRRQYDRSLTASDQLLQQVLSAFAHRPADRMPIVIVTADHGEALGEHGQPYHSTDLYNAQIRVPLVIAGPGIAAHRIPETVSITDLVPTVLDLAGFVPPRGPSVDGRSLADLATGARAAVPDGGLAFAAMIKDRSNPGGITALVNGRWKLIDNHDTLELYDTRADPDERTNVIGQHPQEAGLLRKLLDARIGPSVLSPLR